MNIDKKWIFVSSMLDIVKDNYDSINEISEILKINPESVFHNHVHTLCESIVKMSKFILDDKYDFIEWYVHECDFGRKPKEAGCDGSMIIIDSYEKLREVMEAVCK